MATVLLTEPESTEYVRSSPSPVRDRLRAWLCHWSLDHALAGGVPPDSSVALSLRAHKLIGHPIRIAMAHEIRAIAKEVSSPRCFADPRVPICRRALLESVAALDALADRLEAPDAVEARGVARLLVVLRDGTGPLFNPARADRLADALTEALEALEPSLEF